MDLSRKSKSWLVCAVLLLLPCGLSASEEERGLVAVHSDIEGLTVWVDSVQAGRTPIDSLSLAAGIHHIRVRHPDPLSWMAKDREETVRIVQDSSIQIHCRFPKPVWVSSDPEHAQLSVQGRRIGLTPGYVLCPDSGLTLRFEKQGYQSRTFFLEQDPAPSIHVPMTPLPDFKIHSQDESLFRSRPVWVTFLLSFSSGIAGYVFKTLAEQSYNRYQEAAHPDAMNRHFDRATLYDQISGACYVTCEVNFGLAIYFSIRGARSR